MDLVCPMGPSSNELFVVVTGGPGAGKTTLLDELHNRGFAVAPEAARAVIKEQRRIGGRGLESVDPQLLVELVLSWEIRSYRAAERSGRLTFFDRSLVELPAWLRALGRPVPPYVDKAVRLFRYGTPVFHAPAWREIYTNDAERTQSWAHAERVSGPGRQVYVDAGYEVVTLPLTGPRERADFVLETLRAGQYQPFDCECDQALQGEP
jgi:predicted ATPase